MWINRIFLIAFIFVYSTFQAEVVITGEAPQYIGKEIMAFSYVDHFTKSLYMEDVVKVDSLGNFTLQFDSDEIQLINLRCDYVNAHLYVEPESKYDILFPPLPIGQSKSINNTAMVDVFFNVLDEQDVNNQIIKFNEQYNRFFENNLALLTRISRPGSRAKKDSTTSTSRKSAMTLYTDQLSGFSKQMDSLFNEMENPFFQVYRKSIEADMYQNARTEPKFIYDQYIKPFSVNIKHPEQVHFLTNFYDNYFSQFDKKFELDELKSALNSVNPLEGSLAVMSKDDFLENKPLREMILSYTLFSEWENKTLSQEKTRSILTELSIKGSDSSSRKLAKNINDYLSVGMAGYPAYNFTLLDKNKEEHRLVDFKGKYIVLEFWASWCQSCLKEMSLSSRLAEEYNKDFDVISISIDEDRDNMIEYIKDHPDLNQIILHMDQDKLIMDHYKIRSLPAYVIIDPLSNTMISEAPFPSLHLEEKLHKIKVSEKEKEIDNFDKK